MNVSMVAKTICVTRVSSNATTTNVFQRNTPVITKMIVAMDLMRLNARTTLVLQRGSSVPQVTASRRS